MRRLRTLGLAVVLALSACSTSVDSTLSDPTGLPSPDVLGESELESESESESRSEDSPKLSSENTPQVGEETEVVEPESITDGQNSESEPLDPLLKALAEWEWPEENEKCTSGPFQIGYSRGKFVVLSCGPDGAWHPQDGQDPVEIDPDTSYPLEVVLEIKARLAEDPNNPDFDSRTEPSYEFASVTYPNLEPCKLRDQETVRPHHAIGFPMPSERPKLSGTLVVQVVAVDFEGDRSEGNPKVDLKNRWQAVERFWERMSAGKADIVFRFTESYLDLPGTFESYGISSPFSQFMTYGNNFFAYAHEAVALADPDIDFSDVDVVLVSAPTDIDNQVGTYVAESSMPNRPTKVITDEKTIYNLLIRGGDEPADLDNWIHEFGHMLGLTDFGHDGPQDDIANVEKGFYDIMTAYRNRELYAWNRFLLGVVDSKQIDCKTDLLPSTHWLRPIEDSLANKKAVMIPLSNHEILIVESRRKGGLDTGLSATAEGAVVYRVNTRVGPPENALRLVSPGKRYPGDIRNQQALKLGEKVEYGGWRIEVLDAGQFGDVVEISPAS